ncbi:hypothetical protein ASPVEDRAFT_84492 [Aspergillus versicolor CBS 583.65]|uniref:Arrestin-like N-terminal domain-containing protein n=1 Tax=Aspergillus versicolor CBS 583.65 TaxID=1036611 RepID=A0A1L9PNB6_ASPVE|nr:uncharacterized protein ASPVEDRAFT_84492 [Aspergillus versicolor CBS 583.65]OJJ03027.1 hypothetical protein ASPVEDRAFT_84492 [Aspergillus versicolor CBS 583.65]
MSPRLNITGLRNGKAYSSTEAVKGVVHLKAGSGAPVDFQVTATLEGVIRTSLIEKGPAFILGNDMPLVASENHQLFRTSKVVFPDQNSPSSTFQYTPFNGEYAIPFEINFPLQTQCAKHPDEPAHKGVTLPSSFEARATMFGAAARVQYTVRIDVKGREGDASFKRVVMISAAAPPLYLALMSNRALRTTSTVKLPHLHLQYTPPTLSLEARLPSPILRIGQRLPLRMFVRGPLVEGQALFPSKLSSLRISLESTTNIRAEARHKSWTTSTDLLNLKTLNEPVTCLAGLDVLPDINRTIFHRVSIPDVAPSFASCTVEHTYSLAVDARFSFCKARKVQSTKLVLKVEIWPANRTVQSPSAVPSRNCSSPQDRIPTGELPLQGCTQVEAYDSEPPPYS